MTYIRVRIRVYILLNSGHRNIVIWHCCLFLCIIFWTYQTVLLLLVLAFSHSVIISTLLMVIYQIVVILLPSWITNYPGICITE